MEDSLLRLDPEFHRKSSLFRDEQYTHESENVSCSEKKQEDSPPGKKLYYIL